MFRRCNPNIRCKRQLEPKLTVLRRAEKIALTEEDLRACPRSAAQFGRPTRLNLIFDRLWSYLMSSPINPYRKWLGIPERELPADHYRLLGIERFESDPDVIQSSVDRQVQHVMVYLGGEHDELARLLAQEIETAGRCLLNPDLKRIYDEALKQRSRADADKWEMPPMVTPIPATPVVSAVLPPPALLLESAAESCAREVEYGDDPPAEFAGVRAGKRTKRRKRRSLAIGLLGHVLAPIAGLSLGYVILVFCIDERYDFLKLFDTKSLEPPSSNSPLRDVPEPSDHEERIH
jgi:hypothetical protein